MRVSLIKGQHWEELLTGLFLTINYNMCRLITRQLYFLHLTPVKLHKTVKKIQYSGTKITKYKMIDKLKFL